MPRRACADACRRGPRVAATCHAAQLSAQLAALEARAARRGAGDGAAVFSRSLRRCYIHKRAPAADAPRARAGEGEGEAVTDGEEEARAAWTLRVRASVLRALDLGPSLATEAQLLAHRTAAGAAGAAGTLAPPRRDAPEQQQPGLARGVAAAAAALACSDVERLRAGVFRPSHILPTMTVEQFGASRARTFRACAAVCREVQTANGREGLCAQCVCAVD